MFVVVCLCQGCCAEVVSCVVVGCGILQPLIWRYNYTTHCLPQPGSRIHNRGAGGISAPSPPLSPDEMLKVANKTGPQNDSLLLKVGCLIGFFSVMFF